MAVTKLSNSGIATGGVLKYDSMLAGNAAYSPGDFHSIATISVGAGGAANVEFTSIPSTYTHLQIRAIARKNDGDFSYASISFNTGSPARFHELVGTGSTVEPSTQTSSLRTIGVMATGASSLANVFSNFIIDILDYADTTRNKACRVIGGFDLNNGGRISLVGNFVNSTTAITSITLDSESGSWVQYSHFALYGIKAA